MLPTFKRLLTTKTLWTGLATILVALGAALNGSLPGDWPAFFALLLGELHLFNARDTKAKEKDLTLTNAFISSGTETNTLWMTPIGQWLMNELRKRFSGGVLGTVLAIVTPLLEDWGRDKLMTTSVDVKREVWARVTSVLRAAKLVPTVSIPARGIVFTVFMLFTLTSCFPVIDAVWPPSPEPDRLESYLILEDASATLASISESLQNPVVDEAGVLLYATTEPLYGVVVHVEGDSLLFGDKDNDQCTSTIFGGGWYCVLESIPQGNYAFIEMTCDACSVRVEHALVERGVKYSTFVDGFDLYVPPN